MIPAVLADLLPASAADDDDDDMSSSGDSISPPTPVPAAAADNAAGAAAAAASGAYEAATAAAATAASVAPVDALPDGPSAPLPRALQFLHGAHLSLTPLQSHLLLFPAHRWDAAYLDTSRAVEDRRTSLHTADEEELKKLGCPVMMNTPDERLNAPDESPLPPILPLQQQQQPEQPPRYHREEEQEENKAGPTHSPPASAPSSSPPSQSPFAAEEEEMRDGFVQCVKCHKWRTVPDEVDSKSLPWNWSCDRNHWDSRLARCAVSEESFEEGEGGWPGMPKRLTRPVAAHAFYTRLVALLLARQREDPARVQLEGGNVDELEKFPTIRRRPLDLHKAYLTVLSLGGYDKVSASNQWKIVQSALHMSDAHDSSSTLKRMYRKFLLDYEQANWRNPRAKLGGGGAAASRQSARSAPKVQSFAEFMAHQAPAAGAGAQLAKESRKRNRPLPQLNQQAPYAAADGGSDDEDAMQPSRKRGRPAAGIVGVDAGDVNMLEDWAEDADGGDSDGGGVGGASAPASRSYTASSLPAPTLNALNIAVRNMRNSMESRLRTLEKRTEERLQKMEGTLMTAINAGLSNILAQAASTATAQKAKFAAHVREQERRSDLLAKGMNMIISERLKANLPKLAQIKLRTAAQNSATAAAASVDSKKNGKPASAAAASSVSLPATTVTLVPMSGAASSGSVFVASSVLPLAAAAAGAPAASSSSTVPASSSAPSSAAAASSVAAATPIASADPLTFSVRTFVPSQLPPPSPSSRSNHTATATPKASAARMQSATSSPTSSAPRNRTPAASTSPLSLSKPAGDIAAEKSDSLRRTP